MFLFLLGYIISFPLWGQCNELELSHWNIQGDFSYDPISRQRHIIFEPELEREQEKQECKYFGLTYYERTREFEGIVEHSNMPKILHFLNLENVIDWEAGQDLCYQINYEKILDLLTVFDKNRIVPKAILDITRGKIEEISKNENA